MLRCGEFIRPKLSAMKIRNGLWAITVLSAFCVGVVGAFVLLRRYLDRAMAGQKEIEARMDELRADMDAANTELLIVRAELDLRQEQLRRLGEEDGGEWRSMN